MMHNLILGNSIYLCSHGYMFYFPKYISPPNLMYDNSKCLVNFVLKFYQNVQVLFFISMHYDMCLLIFFINCEFFKNSIHIDMSPKYGL